MKLQFLLRLFNEQIYILFIQYDLIKYCFYSNHLETILNREFFVKKIKLISQLVN